MSREMRDFYQRSEPEQRAFLTQTWCGQCMQADLGMKEPREYAQDSAVYIEGKCLKCGQPVITKLTDDSF